MKYVLLIYQPSPFDPRALTPAEHKAIADQYRAITATPNVVPGFPLGLLKEAVTVRLVNNQVVAANGPYMNEIGAVGGYFVFDADTKEEAIAPAARVPAARLGGAVEVRPAEAYW